MPITKPTRVLYFIYILRQIILIQPKDDNIGNDLSVITIKVVRFFIASYYVLDKIKNEKKTIQLCIYF